MSKRNKHHRPRKRVTKRNRAARAKRKASEDGNFATNPVNVRSRAEFERYLEDALPVLVDFWAPWCAPCRVMAPIFEKVGKQFEGRIHFLKVDTEAVPELAAAFGVRSIPTVIALQCTDVIDSHVGILSEQALAKMAQRADDRAEGVSLRQRLKRMFAASPGAHAAAP